VVVSSQKSAGNAITASIYDECCMFDWLLRILQATQLQFTEINEKTHIYAK